MDIAPPTDFAFIGIPRDPPPSTFPPFRLSAHGPQQNPTPMRSLLLVLIAFPLASFPLAINYADAEAPNCIHNNGTTSSQYSLQDEYKGNTFFKYVEARLFFLPPGLSYLSSDWDFFSDPDPTHGNVAYQTKANSKDLAYVDADGTAVLRVDNKSSVPAGGNRRS